MIESACLSRVAVQHIIAQGRNKFQCQTQQRHRSSASWQKGTGLFASSIRVQSLYELHDRRVRLYLRYSKVHGRNQAFYGLREEDLRRLEGHASVICLLWNDQSEPLSIPFSNYEEVFHTVRPATDGQYKAQVYMEDGGTELYLAQAGRFNVEGNLWQG